MRIGIVGKGGSGKTTLSALLALRAAQAKQAVFALDADFNQHLAGLLGSDRQNVPTLASAREKLVQYVMGSRNDIVPASFTKTTKPAHGSRLVRLQPDDPFLAPLLARSPQGISLLRIGDFGSERKGVGCYHGLTAVADILLNHLAPLTSQQTFITDFTAGVDPFASPITNSFDAFVLAVEPTLKGIEVARQWRHLLGNDDTPLLVVVNKTNTEEETAWVKQQLPNEQICASLNLDPALRRVERGEPLAIEILLPANRQALDTIWASLNVCTAHSL